MPINPMAVRQSTTADARTMQPPPGQPVGLVRAPAVPVAAGLGGGV